MRRALVVVVRARILRGWHGSGVRAEGRVALWGDEWRFGAGERKGCRVCGRGAGGTAASGGVDGVTRTEPLASDDQSVRRNES